MSRYVTKSRSLFPVGTATRIWTAEGRPFESPATLGGRTEPLVLLPRPAVSTPMVFVGICLMTGLHVASYSPDIGSGALSVTCVATLSALVLYLERFEERLRTGGRTLLLVVLVALTFLPILEVGTVWISLPGFLAGGVLLVLSGRAAWFAFGAVVLGIGMVQATFDHRILTIVYTLAWTAVTGLAIYDLARLSIVNRRVRSTCAELTQGAAAQERTRIARDLHDLLGSSLSAITLKNELTLRLVDDDPQRARCELSDALLIARRALADVRGLAEPDRLLSFDDECRSAASVLAAAEVAVELELGDMELLPHSMQTVFAVVLREGVTNLLRHSTARICRISVHRGAQSVRLDIVNDGVTRTAARNRRTPGGSGLENLESRLATLNGRLLAVAEPGGRFRLGVTVPLPGRRRDAGRSSAMCGAKTS